MERLNNSCNSLCLEDIAIQVISFVDPLTRNQYRRVCVSFSKAVSTCGIYLSIDCCKFYTQLPTLGEQPLIKGLEIENLGYGHCNGWFENQDFSNISHLSLFHYSHQNSVIAKFPNLTSLQLDYCLLSDYDFEDFVKVAPNLKRLIIPGYFFCKHPSSPFTKDHSTFYELPFTQLEELDVSGDTPFSPFPHATNLKSLTLNYFPGMNQVALNFHSLTELNVKFERDLSHFKECITSIGSSVINLRKLSLEFKSNNDSCGSYESKIPIHFDFRTFFEFCQHLVNLRELKLVAKLDENCYPLIHSMNLRRFEGSFENVAMLKIFLSGQLSNLTSFGIINSDIGSLFSLVSK